MECFAELLKFQLVSPRLLALTTSLAMVLDASVP